jgi:hypothetical protein
MKTCTLLMAALFALTVLTACQPREVSTQPTQPASSIPPSPTVLEQVTATPINAEPSSTFPPSDATTTPEIFNPVPIEAVLADKTRQDLATYLGFDFNQISLLENTRQAWPDSCLGLAPADNQACAKASVPGWRIVLNAAGHTHEYRASENGSLVVYSGPVSVVGPQECKISGTSLVFSPEDGYCFAYPVSFHRTDERGPIAVYGPVYASSAGELSTSLNVDISLLPESQTLESAVEGFLGQLGVASQPELRQSIVLAGAPATLLEVVPGTPGTRDVFVLHNNLLFHFIFKPAPSVAADAAADVEELYQLVMGSLTFVP